MATSIKLTHEQFTNALTYTRVGDKSKKLAYAYLVEGLTLPAIAEQNDTTKQNVYKSTQRILAAYEKYKAAQQRMGKL